MATTHFPDRKRGPLTPAERREIERLADRGLAAGQIALRLSRIPATINFAMHGMGLKTPARRNVEYRRGRSDVRSFTPVEDAFIQRERARGLLLREVAALAERRFGHRRTTATLSIRLRMLANVEPRPGTSEAVQ